MDTYKLQLKVGQHEFHAEGPVDDVKRDFELWKSMIGTVPAPRSVAEGAITASGTPGDLPPRDTLERLFIHDEKKKIVTLRILPRSEDRNGESLLLLVFGFRAMAEFDEVPVTVLRTALRQSGCTVDRVDQVAGKYVRQGLLNKGGRGKGGKYSLTNAGSGKTMSLLTTLLTS